MSSASAVVVWKPGSSQGVSATPLDLCEVCGKKPKFLEKHRYCGRTCARKSPGVNFNRGCVYCNRQPRTIESVPSLKELNDNEASFKHLRAQFLREWRVVDPNLKPKFEKAYEVTVPHDVSARYDAFRASHPSMVEICTFHSSQCICDLGFNRSTLCSIKSCGICSIIRSSFRSFAFGAPFNNGRFGQGIYCYQNPALADGFATSCLSSPYRVMIACNAVGTLESENAAATTESIFVPGADAIVPTYVIMYKKISES